MFKFAIISVLCMFYLNVTAIHQKLPISVYYESLCPDSVKFIVNQLYPTYKQFGQYLDITFIPFGKSSSINGGEEFTCQHGPKECIGNKLQSCTLNLLQQNDLQVEYVYCMMRGGSTAKECANLVGVPWDQIKECYYSQLGTSLQLNAEASTTAVKASFIPTVIINSRFDQSEQDTAQINFQGLICEYLKQIYVNICN